MALPFTSGYLSLSPLPIPGHTSLSSILCSLEILPPNIHFLCHGLSWKPSENSLGIVECRCSYLAFTHVSSVSIKLG